MSEKHALSRRDFLRLTATAATGAVVAACAPAAPQIVEVEKPVVVEREVIKEVPVERVVEKVVEVEKEVKPVGPLKIAFWSPASQQDVTGGEKLYIMTDNFNEAHQGELYVEYVYTPVTAGTQMVEKLLTNIAAGTPPECAYFDRFIVISWAAEGSLMDLTEYAAPLGIGPDDYYPFAWGEANWKGRLYALPFDTDCRALYYNKDLFAEAGLPTDEEDIPMDLDEFDAMEEKLTIKEGPRFKQMGHIPWRNTLFNMGCTFGATFYDKETFEIHLTEPKLVATAYWFLKYAEKYGIESVSSFSDAFGGGAQRPLFTKLLATEYTGDWVLGQIERYVPDLNFGVIPMPYPEGGRVATMAGGWSTVLPTGSPNPDAGWEFISWLCSPEQVHWFCKETMHIPTQTKYAADPIYTANPKHKVFMDLMPIADARPMIPAGQVIYSGLNEARDLIIHGQGTPEEVLGDLNDRANKAMQKYL